MRRVTAFLLASAALSSFAALPLGAAPTDPQAACRAAINDDTVRPYQASLQTGFVKAFRQLFPDAQGGPDANVLKPDAAMFRCMDGRLLACFVGANLPCAKIATSRRNPGAEAFCRQQPNADVVPMFATGHGTLWSYRCQGGRAVAAKQNWKLDRRGFATQIWAPMN